MICAQCVWDMAITSKQIFNILENVLSLIFWPETECKSMVQEVEMGKVIRGICFAIRLEDDPKRIRLGRLTFQKKKLILSHAIAI